MDHFPSQWGKPRNENIDYYNTVPLQRTLPDPTTQAAYGPVTRTQFRDIERLYPVGEHTVVGASGDLSDYQYIQHLLDSLMVKEHCSDDGHVVSARHIHEYLWRVMYNRRSKFNPLWNSLVVGGMEKGERFLGFVDLRGTTYQTTTIATGFGAYLAQPILRKRVEGREDDITEQEAIEIINDCMRVLFYRDARSLNKAQTGVEISEPYSVDTEWSFAESIRGYGADV
ncbi:Proteasome subunit beta type-7 [Apophysomyces ossiformis]|uniref:Proteasome subunit beta n=1 Tax=Apophysomyces ossiformis TaxID=679940 RepID=A0A8H7BRS1_9FUNG|nr:Proteasome subunit beta type-7 [Apophysomyces ossiformis]